MQVLCALSLIQILFISRTL